MYPVTVAPARRVALGMLARVRKQSAFSGAVVSVALGKASLSPADAALATRLVYGTLSAEGVLDEALDRHLSRGVEPRVRDVLRLAAFELLFSRAPAYAVVDQAVDLARGVRPQASGLVNAVVRKIAAEASTFPWGDPSTDRDALARASGHPRWIVDLAITSLGETAAREMLGSGLEPAPTYVRLDPFEADRATAADALSAAEPEPSPPDPDCYRLGHASAVFARPAEPHGWFPMDAAAQMAPAALRPTPGMAVLDVGSGRGNKTVCIQAIASRHGGPAEVTAVDVHEGKVRTMRERLDRSGVPGVNALVCDATDLAAVFGPDAFDAVLVDAPCSGLGTLRRYPEKRWRLDPGAPARMAVLQSQLLEAASRVVRPGGVVVYSTCSVAAEENDGVVSGFLAGESGRGFRAEPLGDLIPLEWGTFRDGAGSFRSWPTSGGPDGHFVAVLRRSSE